MRLEDIICDSGVLEIRGNANLEVSGICSDSRKVVPGSLFIAVKGHDLDGQLFISSALKAGATAVVYEDEEICKSQTSAYPNTVLIKVADSRHAVAIMASNFYGNPSRELTLVGITGTNGKTTTVTILYNLFTKLGYKCGLLSTIANYVGDCRYDTVNTTSDPITTNALLAEMVAVGCGWCFMEVSSIGLEQERVSGLTFAVGIFSNLTHDHLDYHKTFAEYLRCKKLFFDNLSPNAFALINTDDRNGEIMVQNTKAKVVTYALKGMADHNARIIEEGMEGMCLRIDGKEIWTRLIGRHNAYNILAAYSTAVCLGTIPEEGLLAISSLEPVKGRLENMQGPKGLSTVIDYAHTPDALENVLSTLREVGRERELVCVFGCGGDRDKTKRPEMAAVAEKMADKVIVTSDNSRTENTECILNDIRQGFSQKGLAKTLFIADRREAIRTAIILSQENATILLAGKGHETYQIIGSETRHFDEREIVTEVYKTLENR